MKEGATCWCETLLQLDARWISIGVVGPKVWVSVRVSRYGVAVRVRKVGWLPCVKEGVRRLPKRTSNRLMAEKNKIDIRTVRPSFDD